MGDTPQKRLKLDQEGPKSPTVTNVDLDFWKNKQSGPSGTRELGATKSPGSSKRSLDYNFWCTEDKQLQLGELNAGPHGRTTVIGRVVYISTNRPKKSGGGQKCLRFHLLDHTGEMEAVAFREAAYKFEEIVKINEVFKLTGFYVRAAKPQFPTGLVNDQQLVFEEPCSMSVAAEDEKDLPAIPFNFKELDAVTEGETVDLLCIIQQVMEPGTVKIAKTGEEILRREIIITDKSQTVAALTLWGSMAESFDGKVNQTIALRRADARIYNGILKVTTKMKPEITLVWVNPDLNGARSLSAWFEEVTK